MDFQPWKDYLQLASVIQKMARLDISESHPATDHLLDPPKTPKVNTKDEGHIHSKVQLLTYSQAQLKFLCTDSETQLDSLAHQKAKPRGKMCHFCKHNGESHNVYTGHNLKDEQGRIICPVLQMYTCTLCGATGESSHTKKYCPMNNNKILYKKSGRNCALRKVKR
ncbi:nanos homolog 2 [Pseudophryne corroboree]|uniref:nanos homolog 2 n=1 Tax=Pseudophryne corroboree TaxID=495146 RepID=UPI0030812D42